MDACKCPITKEVFQDPVVGDDGHTYERQAITDWLKKNSKSPITRQPMDIKSLKPNYAMKKTIEEFKSIEQLQQAQYQFQLDVHIRKTKPRPLFQGFGKAIYEVEWINRDGPPIILLKIDGAKAKREASFYVQLSCHPHIVRTFGIVQSNPGSVMLLQECAPHGDLSELLRENGFKPNEAVLWEIFRQICDAMICLADNGIIHGDLACRNVLVFSSNAFEPRENLVKLTDFGLTRASKLYSIVDSPVVTTMTIIPVRYVAPEILENPDKSNYTEKSDVYSMGVLMWEACSYGELPYSDIGNDEAIRKRKLNDERLPQPPMTNHELWTIMNTCWRKKPSSRPTFKTLKESLQSSGNASTVDREQTWPSQAHRNPERLPVSEQCARDDSVYIPCEFCNQPIDTLHWSAHIEICRQAEQNRLENLRQRISKAPIIAQIPCEFCNVLCSVDEIKKHQISCAKKRSPVTSGATGSNHGSARKIINSNKVEKPINSNRRYITDKRFSTSSQINQNRLSQYQPTNFNHDDQMNPYASFVTSYSQNRSSNQKTTDYNDRRNSYEEFTGNYSQNPSYNQKTTSDNDRRNSYEEFTGDYSQNPSYNQKTTSDNDRRNSYGEFTGDYSQNRSYNQKTINDNDRRNSYEEFTGGYSQNPSYNQKTINDNDRRNSFEEFTGDYS